MFDKYLFKARLLFTKLFSQLLGFLHICLVVISFISIGLVVFDLGYKIPAQHQLSIQDFFVLALLVFTARTIYGIVSGHHTFKGISSQSFERFSTLFLFIITAYNFLLLYNPEYSIRFIDFLGHRLTIYSSVLFFSLLEISAFISGQMKRKFNPAPLFAGSFMIIIFLGAGLLMLPNSTASSLSFIDALFTSTSAVCVTGLITVDTATAFTETGKLIILLLMQIGGLGVITFTSFLGILLVGKTSLSHDMVVKDFLSHEMLGQVIKILRNIILSTLIIEFVGAYLIYQSINGANFADIEFSVFHAVSSFCNAGFSTLSGNMNDPLVRDNYSLHFIIAILIVVGGIGFPVLANFGYYFRHVVDNVFHRIVNKRSYKHIPKIIAINSRLAIYTTLGLLLVGTLFFFVSEYDNVMQGKTLAERLVTSFFMSVTPRTAGFNTVDMSLLMNPTVLFTILLMWIGASPISTGGGIKTTTFSIAIMSLYSTLRGRDHVEIYRREIARDTVQRAFAMIMASLFTLFIGISLVSYFEPQATLKQVVFECVSAISTTGLSLDFTATISSNSKIVLILLMYLGRVGLLTIFSLMVKKIATSDYNYPKTSVLIG
ncbi:MAG: potassium transporter TrkG [Bacteroidales bacterium]|nr:potassium transporter TrkG [Bacteroidales bacterium]